ncbi:MAG: LysE family translocator [Microbacterium sp.]
MGSGILAFTAIAVVVTLMPGADSILVLRTSLRDGARAAFVTALGVSCGPVLWGALAGAGVALVLARLPVLYAIIALAGSLYLGWLAFGSLRASLRLWRQSAPIETPPEKRTRSHFLTGLVTNLLNPKIGAFYLAVMPGLFPPSDVTPWLGAALGAIHGVLGVVYLGLVAVLAGWARRFLTRPRANAVVEALCALCLLAFAVYLAVSTIRSLVALGS